MPPAGMRDCSTAPAHAEAEIVEGIPSANKRASADGATSIFAAFFFLDFWDYLQDLQMGPWEVLLPEAQASEGKPLLSGAPLLHIILTGLGQPGSPIPAASIREPLSAKLTFLQ